MSKEKVFWTKKNGEQIDVDDMTVEHLRNTLKMIIRNNQDYPEHCPRNSDDAMAFSDAEMQAIMYKNQYEWNNEENIWKQ